uniref:Glutamate decarboxylase like 1 n=1 Tax=Fundulus heteroclitus TaxID=8078 RepID=A0A3Q2P5S8_FUNHE
MNPDKCSPDTAEDMEPAESFIQQAMEIIIQEAVKKGTNVKEKVCEWRPPEQLKELLDLELKDTGEPESKILQRCRDAIRYSVKTSHPRFFNQLFAGMEPHSMVASFITEAIKTSLYTYEVAPVFTLMEDAVLKTMMELIGWKDGGDGLFNPGGSMSNMYAVNLARYYYCPDFKETGIYGSPRLVMLTSQELFKKIVDLIGNYFYFTSIRGFPTCITEPSPNNYNFLLHNHDMNFKLVVAINVLTVSLLYLIRANSVAWNLHKMLMATLQCSAFLVRDKSCLLQRCHCAGASYLFQQDKFYDVSYDTGDKSVQCSRKPDAFKFWLMWKAVGTRELENRVDRRLVWDDLCLFSCFKYSLFLNVLLQPEFANVCFWYIPPSLRNLPDGPELRKKLHAVAPVVKERMMKSGTMMIGYQKHGDKPNFFRMVVISPQVKRQDLDFVLEEIHRLGKDL